MIPVFESINLSRRNMHILFWLFWVISFTFIKSIGYSMPVYFDWLVYYIITLPVFIVHTYLIAYLLIPCFLIKRKYFLFLVLVTISLFFFSVIELLLSNELIFNYLSAVVPPEENYLDLKNIIISGIGNHYIIVLFLSVKIFKSWYTVENRKNELERDTIEAEIQLVKNQLHPRFLLRTIDLLETMAIDKSEKTPEMIIRISNLMSNILLDNSVDRIRLNKEINLIESYLEIQKMVQHPSLKIQVLRSGDFTSRKIPALSLFPIVENIMDLHDRFAAGNDFKIFVRSENNYLMFQTSSYNYENDPYEKLHAIIDKTKKRLEYYYEKLHRVAYHYNNGYVELTIEIFTHD